MRIKITYITILTLATLLLSFTSCKKSGGGGVSGQLTNITTEGFYIRGVNVLVKSSGDIFQTASNSTARTFRVQNPMQSAFIHAKLSNIPSILNDIVTVQFTTRGVESIKESYEMVLVKRVENKLWLLEKGGSLGAIITL